MLKYGPGQHSPTDEASSDDHPYSSSVPAEQSPSTSGSELKMMIKLLCGIDVLLLVLNILTLFRLREEGCYVLILYSLCVIIRS